MNDTVQKLMEMIDEYAYNASEETRLDYETWHMRSRVKQAFADVQTSRQALQDELQKLFTPLSDEVVLEKWMDGCVPVLNFAREIEAMHGIGEAK